MRRLSLCSFCILPLSLGQDFGLSEVQKDRSSSAPRAKYLPHIHGSRKNRCQKMDLCACLLIVHPRLSRESCHDRCPNRCHRFANPDL
jgi:hypothetical protein